MVSKSSNEPSLFSGVESPRPVGPGTPASYRERERLAPYQRSSPTSRAGAEHIAPQADTVRPYVVRALHAAGPDGLTIEELARAVTLLRGKATKEATICGRVAGDNAELAEYAVKSGRTRPNASGVPADVYVHRLHCEQQA